MKPLLLLIGCTLAFLARAQKVTFQKASTHPMSYYISLPKNWSADREWPVVVALEEAEKQFEKNAQRFADARGDRPFIIVSPVITTNGNYGVRDPKVYPYSAAEWDRIERESNCRFDEEGLEAVLADVQQRFHGSKRYYVTGFEAGTHLLWYLVLHHPERLLAAAPVGGNYTGRCIDTNRISTDASRVQLPVRNFTGATDEYFGKNGKVYGQYLKVQQLLRTSGYRNLSDSELPATGHVPLPGAVLDWFASLLPKH